MKIIVQIILVLFSLFLANFSFAAEQISNALIIPTYFQANCAAITGTWQGFFTDPTDLFGDGGPWPIRISLYNYNGQIIGKADANSAPDYIDSVVSKRIWANCNNGVLRNIFMGEREDCGDFSKGGELVSRNVLILYLRAENAMIGTDFLVILRRINNQYPFPIPSNSNAYILGKIQSCH